nr:MAG TPA: hypothetical protein [Caudoviricetes sp.]
MLYIIIAREYNFPSYFYYIIINTALATPIPKYAMRPATSKIILFIRLPPVY